jgi:hypothetical protein
MMPSCGLTIVWYPLGKSITKGMLCKEDLFVGVTDEVIFGPLLMPTSHY